MKLFHVTARLTCFLFLGLASASFASPNGDGPRVNPSDVLPLSVSPDLKYALITDAFSKGLQLVDTDSGSAVIVSKGANSGVYASISSDGKYVCYKALDNGMQVPMLYDIAAGENKALSAPARLAGTPAAAGGIVAYTLGHDLLVLDGNFNEISRHDLGHHVNLIAISPDGSAVAYNNSDMQIVILNLASGNSRVVTNSNADFWGPQFSPRGDKILASSAAGEIVVGKTAAGMASVVAQGQSAGWADNDTVAYSRRTGTIGKSVDSAVVETVSATGAKGKTVLAEAGDVHAAVVGGNILIARPGSKNLKYGYVDSPGYASVDVPASAVDKSAVKNAGDVHDSQDVVDTTSYKYLSNMKYLHQNNDTQDWWNGNSSCSAAASIMGMQYYNILPKKPITCSYPSTHTSDYGFYVADKYCFNGKCYDTFGSADPNGTIGYGGFGYITRNNWEDTKSYMRDYIINHGPSSAVDWSPTFAKAKTEIDSNKPFILLNSLTTAGHYITCDGYYKSQYTLIFHDPYGNKNSGSYPSPDGKYVRYDWPGYNNGYQNLKTVHCYIYCRFTPPAAPSNLTATAVSSSQINLAWSDNSSCEEYYDVYRSTSSGTGFSRIAILASNTKSYSATGLSASTKYYFHVKARSPAGSSAASNEASATTAASNVTIVVDNNQSGFAASSNWSTGTSAADKYGTDYRFRSTAAVSDSATWTFSLSSAANADIFAWWPAGTNRSASAPYILPDGTTVKVNQQANGGKWNLLGTKSLPSGSSTVKLSCWTTTGYVVMADAIKVVTK